MCVLSKGLEGTTFLKEVRTLLTQYVYGWMDVILKLQDNATFLILTVYVSFFYCLSFTNTHIFLLLLLLVRCCLCILKNETFFSVLFVCVCLQSENKASSLTSAITNVFGQNY